MSTVDFQQGDSEYKCNISSTYNIILLYSHIGNNNSIIVASRSSHHLYYPVFRPIGLIGFCPESELNENKRNQVKSGISNSVYNTLRVKVQSITRNIGSTSSPDLADMTDLMSLILLKFTAPTPISGLDVT